MFAAAPDWLVSWITTLWMISGGVLCGLIVLLILWGLLWIVRRQAAREVPLVDHRGSAVAGDVHRRWRQPCLRWSLRSWYAIP